MAPRAARAAPPCSCRRRAAPAARPRAACRAARAAAPAPHGWAAPSSPDAHALLRGQVQPVCGARVERAVPGIDVAHHAVHAILRRAVGIARDLRTQILVALLLAPHLRPGQEKALRSEEHTSELQSQSNLVCRLLLE